MPNGFIIQKLNYMEEQFTTEESNRALALLNRIEANPDITQVTLADELDVAVGTINWYLKRLIAKGYVKVKRAQRKKLRYIITPEGIALRAALTVDYIKTSFDLYRRVRERTQKCLEELKFQGYNHVSIIGDGEIAEVVRLSCLEEGISVTQGLNAPSIVIQGIKLALNLPADESLPTSQIRGQNG